MTPRLLTQLRAGTRSLAIAAAMLALIGLTAACGGSEEPPQERRTVAAGPSPTNGGPGGSGTPGKHPGAAGDHSQAGHQGAPSDQSSRSNRSQSGHPGAPSDQSSRSNQRRTHGQWAQLNPPMAGEHGPQEISDANAGTQTAARIRGDKPVRQRLQ